MLTLSILIIILCFALTFKSKFNYIDIVYILSIIGIFITLVLLFKDIIIIWDDYIHTIIFIFYNTIIITPLLHTVSIILLSIVLIYLIFNYNIKDWYYSITSFTLPITVLFNSLAMLLLIHSVNLIILFIAIELQSYTLYILTRSNQTNNKNSNKSKLNIGTKDSILYYILGTIGSILILLGIVLLYGITNSLNIIEIGRILNISNIEYGIQIDLSILLIILGFLFKLGIAPIHKWLIDIYINTHILITMYISLVTKISIIIVIINLYYSICIKLPNFEHFIFYINILLLLTIIVGTTGGLIVVNLKTIIAYSGLTNTGYILYSIINSKSIDTLGNTIEFILQYSILHIAWFILIIAVLLYYNNNIYIYNNNNNKNKIIPLKSNINYNNSILSININQFSSLISYNKTLTILYILLLTNLMGIPPFIGFITKYNIITNILPNSFTISIIIIIISLISAYYYIIHILYILSINNNISNEFINSFTLGYKNRKFNKNLFNKSQLTISILASNLIILLLVLPLLINNNELNSWFMGISAYMHFI
uniref:NADH-ubiquinone oxidoreductase chain 2 n=1 Tax=Groenewaldozyma salmanticensis TaxID=49332 RepID=E5L089_9ASCO|nr:NADH dehydrogenase subunit 2 [Groenewaldozyma salmanticensis]ADO51054.1 NADH dehydrogenase subunit 2 [Groenewaldozyma salmanticensis]